MKLKKLSMKNFRGFDELTVEFDERLSVIVGINGSGKTAILEAASIALGTYFSKFDGLSAPSIGKGDARIKSYEMGESDDVESQYPVVISANAKTGTGEVLNWSRTLTRSQGRTTIGDAREMIQYGEIAQEKVRAGDADFQLPFLGYYGTGRLWDYHRDRNREHFDKSTASRTNGYRDCLDGTANIKLMMHWFEKKTVQDLRKKENQEIDYTLSAVLKAIAQCFESASNFKDIKVQYNFDLKSLEVIFTDESEKRMRLPFDRLSDGYKGAVSLVADIAYRMATLNPQLKDRVLSETDGVVLIDEVDLHLHPAWQKKVIKDLMSIFPKIQLIVTTHAPSVISSVKKENLRILKGNQVYQMNGEVYGKDVKSVMSEIMGVSDRPDDVKSLFDDFYIALNQADWSLAENILDQIGQLRGGHDPELASCQVKLKLERMRRGESL